MDLAPSHVWRTGSVSGELTVVHLHCCCVSEKAGCDLQRGAAAASPAAGFGNPRSQLETRPVLPLHSVGLQPLC